MMAWLVTMAIAVRPFLNQQIMPLAVFIWNAGFLTLWLGWFSRLSAPARYRATTRGFLFLPAIMSMALLPFSVYPFAAQHYTLTWIIIAAVALFVAMQQRFVILLATCCFGGVVMSCAALYQYFFLYPDFFQRLAPELQAGGYYYALELLRQRRVAGAFSSPTLLGSYAAIVTGAAIALTYYCLRRRRFAAGVAGLFLCGVGASALLCSRTVSSLLALAVLVLIVMGHRFARLSPAARFMVSMGAIFILAVTGLTVAARQRYFFDPAYAESSVQQRIRYWHSAQQLFLARPLTGWGAGAFGIVYPRVKQALANETQFPHNIVLQVAAEQGVGGLLAALLFCFAVARAMRLSDGYGLLRYAGGMLALLFIIDNFFNCSSNFDQVLVIWAVTVGLAVIPPESVPATEDVYRTTSCYRAVWLLTGAGVCFSILLLLSARQADVAVRAMAAGDVPAVTAAFRRALRYAPNNDALYAQRAMFGANLPDMCAGTVSEDWRAACERNPYYAFHYYYWALYQVTRAQFATALYLVETAVRHYPAQPVFLAARRECRIRRDMSVCAQTLSPPVGATQATLIGQCP